MFLSPAKLPRILAHRGQPEAENTLTAFQAALSAGADIIETDIRATSDGVPMVFHDENLKRVAGLDDRIADLTFAQLRNKFPAAPSLAEVLAALPATKFNIDFKSDDVVQPAIAAIRAAGAEQRVLITTFSGSRLNRMRKLAPEIAVSLPASRVLACWLAVKTGLSLLVPRLTRGFSAAQIPVSFGLLKLDTPRFIRAIKKANLELHYWVINDVAEADRLLALGADGIVTDQTALMVSHLRKA